MKNLKTAVFSLATLVALAAFASSAKADYYGPNHPYTYGHDGYWDEHHGYHHWDHYHGHDGYWRHDNGSRIWISL